MSVTEIGLVVLGYLMGSVSTAIIIARVMGMPDPRTQGSGNPGATNMLRMGGKKLAVFTLLGDMVKGLIPVLIARALTADATVLAAVAFAAFIGHLYPVFFGFKGGKGVATALGVLLGLTWPVALATLATWIAMAVLFRYSSLSALTAALLAPVYMWQLNGQQAYVTMAAVLSLLLIWRHRSNIRNLLSGNESKIGKKKAA